MVVCDDGDNILGSEIANDICRNKYVWAVGEIVALARGATIANPYGENDKTGESRADSEDNRGRDSLTIRLAHHRTR